VFHHTRAFKQLEKKYKDPEAEAHLVEFLRKQKRGKWFHLW
jgi:hypothetical protein